MARRQATQASNSALSQNPADKQPIVYESSYTLLGEVKDSEATEHILNLASKTLDFMRRGLSTDGCKGVCRLLLPETTAIAVAMTDTENILAYEGELAQDFPAGSHIHTAATLDVLRTGKVGTFENRGHDKAVDGTMLNLPPRIQCGIIVPLNVQDHPVGTIKFYYKSRGDIDSSQLAIARGFGQLLSTQLSTYELDIQAELTARAEVKALQAQINPHFLFNTINTIASLTRTDPARARNLLREFAVFYRQTLENSDQLIPLAREFEQTRRYLQFEHARFGEDRIVEHEFVGQGCGDVLVPAFIVQPIVENAVRHAMRDEGPLNIDIRAVIDAQDVLISVTDDGLGMDEKTCNMLRDKVSEGLEYKAHHYSNSEKGTGIALQNVAERLERFYGYGSGLDIMSKTGEGTCVTLRLAHAGVRQ